MTSLRVQPAILDPVPELGRFLTFGLEAQADPRPAMRRLAARPPPPQTVVGVGLPLVLAFGAKLSGLRSFPGLSGPGCNFPSTQGGLWCFLGAHDASSLHDRAQALRAVLGPGFVVEEEVSAFRYHEGRDLTGFVDGTENPTGEKALAAAVVSGAGPGLDGSSFVATQRYLHDLASMARLAPAARDEVIGRRLDTNEEMTGAPADAHVKRTAQESFDPPAFMLRRSMPWGGVEGSGLYFVAYGESLDRFERVLRRMAGVEDGLRDRLLGHTRALSGSYYWCPPLDPEGRLSWAALDL